MEVVECIFYCIFEGFSVLHHPISHRLHHTMTSSDITSFNGHPILPSPEIAFCHYLQLFVFFPLPAKCHPMYCRWYCCCCCCCRVSFFFQNCMLIAEITLTHEKNIYSEKWSIEILDLIFEVNYRLLFKALDNIHLFHWNIHPDWWCGRISRSVKQSFLLQKWI